MDLHDWVTWMDIEWISGHTVTAWSCCKAGIPKAWADALQGSRPEDTAATRAFSGRLGRSLKTVSWKSNPFVFFWSKKCISLHFFIHLTDSLFSIRSIMFHRFSVFKKVDGTNAKAPNNSFFEIFLPKNSRAGTWCDVLNYGTLRLSHPRLMSVHQRHLRPLHLHRILCSGGWLPPWERKLQWCWVGRNILIQFMVYMSLHVYKIYLGLWVTVFQAKSFSR